MMGAILFTLFLFLIFFLSALLAVAIHYALNPAEYKEIKNGYYEEIKAEFDFNQKIPEGYSWMT